MAHAKGIIRRANHERRFVQVENGVARDPRLTLRARGLLLYMLSLPDDYEFAIKRIAKDCLEGREAIAGALRELKEFGYATVVRERGADGLFRTVTLVDETGQLGASDSIPILPIGVAAGDAPGPGNQGSGGPGHKERPSTKTTELTRPPRSRSARGQPATSEPEVARDETRGNNDGGVPTADVAPARAEPSSAPPEDEKPPRRRDPYWDALATVFPTTTDGERGMIGAAKRELLSIVPQPPPELVERAARWVRAEWPGCTPKALTQHWSLAVERSGRGAHGRAPAASANPNATLASLCRVCNDGTPAFAATGYCKPHLHEAEAQMGRSRA